MKDPDLDALLARGALSGPARERVLGAVLDRVSPVKRRPWMQTAAVTVLPALAAAAILAIVAHRVSWTGPGNAGVDDFQARGTASAAPRVDASCTGGPMGACPKGSHLVFRTWPGTQPAFLAAFADPTGGGERVWYFSAESGSPQIARGALDQSVVIGPEHAVGQYVIHVVASSRPLTRSEAAQTPAPSLLAAETIALGVVP
jgi:hypothetical protein